MSYLRLAGKRGTASPMTAAPPTIFSRSRFIMRWARARRRQAGADPATFLIDEMAGDIIERIGFMKLEPKNALIVGDWSLQLPHFLEQLGTKIGVGQLGEFDEEQPGPADAIDLIVHLMGLGMVNDLPGALVHARNALTQGGVFVAAFPGAGSLPVLRQITLAADGDRPAPRIHPMVSNQSAASLLQRTGFKRQVVDSHSLKVRYRSLAQLVGDLRDHGLTSALNVVTPPLLRAQLQRAEAAFDALRDSEGKVTETFEILTLTGWK